MQSGYESGAKKTIDISIKAEKMTADVLKSALQEFLSGKAEKKGRMTFKQFIRLLCAFSCLFYREGGTIRNWLKASGIQPKETERQNRLERRQRDLEAENRALRKQLAQKDEVIEILKKSVGILSRP